MEEKDGGLRDGQGQQRVIIEHSIREWKLGNGVIEYPSRGLDRGYTRFGV
jgi:hypothetical protein